MMFSRNGNAPLDSMTILIILFGFAITTIIGMSIFDEANQVIQSDSSMANESKQLSSNLYSIYPSLFDNIILFAFVLMIIFSLVAVWLIDSHPIFFIISVILLVGVFVVSMILANVYDDIMSDASFSTYANQFPYTAFITGHILELIIAVSFMIAAAMFIKSRS